MPAPPSSASEPRTLVTHPELRSHQSFPLFQSVGEAPKNAVERALSLFADVRAGEGVGALLLALNVFLLLAGYSLMKPARDGLILTEASAEVKSYAAAAQAVLLMAVVPIYGWLGTLVRRVKLISITSVFFASTLAGLFVAGTAGLRIGIPFFIWLGIINMFIVSQFWAFANDIYTEGQGRRLFPLVGVGQSLGAWVGAAAVTPLVTRGGYNSYSLILMGALIILTALSLTLIVNRREARRGDAHVAATEQATLGREGGFQLLFSDRYLFWIAVLAVLLNLVNTTGGYVLDRLIVEEAAKRFGSDPTPASREFITAFAGSIGATVNLVGFLLQLFVASRVIRHLGVRGGLFILPLLALANYSIIAVAPILVVVRIGKILENSTDYSIQNTIRQALFLPTSREAKYKAKAAIDTFCARAGDVASAGVVGLGQVFGLALPVFAVINVAFTAAWLAVAGQIAREHRKRTI